MIEDRSSARAPFVQRLRTLDFLEPEDFALLESLIAPERTFDAGVDVITEGTAYEQAWIVMDGWGMRYKSLQDGQRQIINFVLPGDIFGLFAPVVREAEYTMETVTKCRLSGIEAGALTDLFARSSRLAVAVTWLGSQGERLLGEQIVRLGRRDASERMAHLFVELCRRQILVGIARESAMRLPLTQRQLADCLGMSLVHANRSFRRLVKDGSVEIQDGRIVLMDLASLSARAGFDSTYLEPVPLPGHGQNTGDT